MTRQPVESSSLKSVGHEGDVLEVEFHSGRVYRHAAFPANEHQKLMDADSIGKHYNAFVRGKYEHSLVEAETEDDGARE